jgi:hypothetical protein
MAGEEKNKQNIQPETPQHDEQPLEHIKSLAPETPNDPDTPTVDDGFPVPVPAGPIL